MVPLAGSSVAKLTSRHGPAAATATPESTAASRPARRRPRTRRSSRGRPPRRGVDRPGRDRNRRRSRGAAGSPPDDAVAGAAPAVRRRASASAPTAAPAAPPPGHRRRPGRRAPPAHGRREAHHDAREVQRHAPSHPRPDRRAWRRPARWVAARRRPAGTLVRSVGGAQAAADSRTRGRSSATEQAWPQLSAAVSRRLSDWTGNPERCSACA